MKQIETLISNTDFGKQLTEQYLNGFYNLTDYQKIRSNFDNLLDQPPKLGHFIPCDENDVPLEMPIVYDGMDSDALLDEKKYFEALDRILFEGFEVIEYPNSDELAVEKSLKFKNIYAFHFQNGVWKKGIGFKNIEELCDQEVKLTQTAKNRIYDGK